MINPGQTVDQIAIGRWAGEESSSGGVSIGRSAGRYTQGASGIAIGTFAGSKNQGSNAVAIGPNSGYDTQGAYAIAIAQWAPTEDKGPTNQGESAIAFGKTSGFTGQGNYAIAIGEASGNYTQGISAIAIGQNAGKGVLEVTATASSQTELPNQIDEYNTDAPPITKHIMVLDTTANIVAGMKIKETSQVVNTVVDATTIELDVSGTQTGTLTFSGWQGASAIAIGAQASVTAQLANTIVINATDTPLHVNKKGGLYIAPIRAVAKNANIVTYDPITKEMATAFPKMPVYDTDDKATKDMTASNVDKTQNGWMYFDKTKKKMKIWIDSKWLAIADEKDLAASKAADGSADGASLGGKLGYIPGSPDSATQSADAFITGGGAGLTAWSMGATSGNPVTVVGPDGKAVGAIPGVDFYWDDGRNHGMESGYVPIFYKDINVVSERVPDNTNNPNAPGNYVTTYDNGHQTIEPIPTAVWNPPLDAFNQLPIEQRRAVLDDYCNATGVWGMTSPVGTNELNRPDAFEGVPFRNFLESQGLGK